jgi:DNA-directed RNA polymerase specialized sigma subunit
MMPESNWALEPDFEEPFRAWQATPSPATSGALLKAVDPILKSAIKSYASGGESPVIRGQAKTLALDAFKNYDPARSSLRTHLLSNLQRLRRVSAQSGQVIRLPERVARDRVLLDTSTQQLADELGREPSDMEIADFTGLPLKRIAQVRKAARPLAEGRFVTESGEEETSAPAVDPLQKRYDQWLEFVHADLSPRDQYILERAMGMHGHKPMSPTNIAKALKVSPAAVSQRMQYIQTLLDKHDQIGLF